MTGTDDRSSEESTETEERAKERKKRSFLRELPILVLATAVIAALVVNFIGRPYVIPSESMEPTLHGCYGCTGDRIFAEKIESYWSDPQPGDVVVFAAPTESWNSDYRSVRSSNSVLRAVQNFLSYFGLIPPDEKDLVKRVIAVGGQTVQCCDSRGRVMVDGKPLDEPYVINDSPFDPNDPNVTVENKGRAFGPIPIPPDHLWVMGDNRRNSSDSRFHQSDEFNGTVPVSAVRGKAVFKIWPPNRIGPLSSRNHQH
ncbi:signal peptidase I [Nocardia transvalensis]|nr:signal peptidase I [Nocardia transvalensis]